MEDIAVFRVALVAFEWVVVPCILVSIAVRGMALGHRADVGVRARASARAGGWAGLILFAIYAVSQRPQDWAVDFAHPAYAFTLPAAAVGFGVGFVLQLMIRRLRDHHIAVGGLALVQVAGGATALFSYVFLARSADRGEIAYLALGVALGALVHEMLFPSGVAAEQREGRSA